MDQTLRILGELAKRTQYIKEQLEFARLHLVTKSKRAAGRTRPDPAEAAECVNKALTQLNLNVHDISALSEAAAPRVAPKLENRVEKGKKYIVWPGHVTSRNDGDRHFISFSKLCRLYGVRESECIDASKPYYHPFPADAVDLRVSSTGVYKVHRA